MESIWVKINGNSNINGDSNNVVSVYYRLPNQGENMDDAYLKQMTDISEKQ